MTKKRIAPIIQTTIILFVLQVLGSCKTNTVYVPVESIKTEHKDKFIKDSVYSYDSVFLKLKGDTVYFEKYKTVYKDRLLLDSVFLSDSIQVPYPVEIIKEVNKLSGWQNFLMWTGIITCVLLLCFVGYKIIMIRKLA